MKGGPRRRTSAAPAIARILPVAVSHGMYFIPQSVAMILTSIIVGLLITRTGRYKPFLVLGGIVAAQTGRAPHPLPEPPHLAGP
mgnify:CR=1 FL=1